MTAIQFAYHQPTSVRTELRAAELQPYPAVKIYPVCPPAPFGQSTKPL